VTTLEQRFMIARHARDRDRRPSASAQFGEHGQRLLERRTTTSTPQTPGMSRAAAITPAVYFELCLSVNDAWPWAQMAG
jgi:hypothetical protein